GCPVHGQGVAPPVLAGWAHGGRTPHAVLASAAGDAPPTRARPTLRVLAPEDGAVYAVDPTLPAEDQAIPVRVSVPPGVDRVELRGDDGHRSILAPPFVGRWPARRGPHRVEVHVEGAPAVTVRFTVR